MHESVLAARRRDTGCPGGWAWAHCGGGVRGPLDEDAPAPQSRAAPSPSKAVDRWARCRGVHQDQAVVETGSYHQGGAWRDEPLVSRGGGDEGGACAWLIHSEVPAREERGVLGCARDPRVVSTSPWWNFRHRLTSPPHHLTSPPHRPAHQPTGSRQEFAVPC